MTDLWPWAYFSMRVASSAAVLALEAWASAALWRVIRNRPGFYDPMRAVAAGCPATTTLLYQTRGWVFGQHVSVNFSPEIVWYAAASLATIAGAHIIYLTVRSYECVDGSSR